QIRPGAPVPELPRIRGVSLRERRRDQEGAQAQGGVLHDARPDAVIRQDDAPCWILTTFSTSCSPVRRRWRHAMSFCPFTTPLLGGGGSPVSCRRCSRPPRRAPRWTRTGAG